MGKVIFIVFAIIVLGYLAICLSDAHWQYDQRYQRAYDTRDRMLPDAQGMSERLAEMER